MFVDTNHQLDRYTVYNYSIIMLTLKSRKNYSPDYLDANSMGKFVMVLTEDQDVAVVRFSGFLDFRDLDALDGQRAELIVEAFTYGNTVSGPWEQLGKGEYLLGYQVLDDTYAVLVAGSPIIVTGKPLRSHSDKPKASVVSIGNSD